MNLNPLDTIILLFNLFVGKLRSFVLLALYFSFLFFFLFGEK